MHPTQPPYLAVLAGQVQEGTQELQAGQAGHALRHVTRRKLQMRPLRYGQHGRTGVVSDKRVAAGKASTVRWEASQPSAAGPAQARGGGHAHAAASGTGTHAALCAKNDALLAGAALVQPLHHLLRSVSTEDRGGQGWVKCRGRRPCDAQRMLDTHSATQSTRWPAGPAVHLPAVHAPQRTCASRPPDAAATLLENLEMPKSMILN